MESYYMGVDVGTTAIKAALFTSDGLLVGQAAAKTRWRPTENGAEAVPSEILASVDAAISAALLDAPDGRIGSIGITSFGESSVVVDSRGRALSPVIAWHDTRDDAQVDALRRWVDPDTFAKRTGLPLRSQWTITKHRWLVDNGEIRSAHRRFSVAEWIGHRLGGAPVSEQSLASRTGWLDLVTRAWWSEALEWSGCSEETLPELVTAGTDIGVVSRDYPVLRLRGAVITIAGHDHQAAAVGAGATKAGDLLDSFGSAEALVRTVQPTLPLETVAQLASAGITTGWAALPGFWTLLGGTEGGLILQSVLSQLGLDDHDLQTLDAAPLPPTRGEVRVAGADSHSVTISGTGASRTPSAVWQGALRLVGEQSQAVHAAMVAAAGTPRDVFLVGGWSKNRAVRQMKDRQFGTVLTTASSEPGVRGAALFGALAAGVFSSTADFPAPPSLEATSPRHAYCVPEHDAPVHRTKEHARDSA